MLNLKTLFISMLSLLIMGCSPSKSEIQSAVDKLNKKINMENTAPTRDRDGYLDAYLQHSTDMQTEIHAVYDCTEVYKGHECKIDGVFHSEDKSNSETLSHLDGAVAFYNSTIRVVVPRNKSEDVLIVLTNGRKVGEYKPRLHFYTDLRLNLPVLTKKEYMEIMEKQRTEAERDVIELD